MDHPLARFHVYRPPASTHRVTQANSVLDAQFTTFADILGAAGYTTVGFCNNPWSD